jgi:hypothetical protein
MKWRYWYARKRVSRVLDVNASGDMHTRGSCGDAGSCGFLHTSKCGPLTCCRFLLAGLWVWRGRGGKGREGERERDTRCTGEYDTLCAPGVGEDTQARGSCSGAGGCVFLQRSNDTYVLL